MKSYMYKRTDRHESLKVNTADKISIRFELVWVGWCVYFFLFVWLIILKHTDNDQGTRVRLALELVPFCNLQL